MNANIRHQLNEKETGTGVTFRMRQRMRNVGLSACTPRGRTIACYCGIPIRAPVIKRNTAKLYSVLVPGYIETSEFGAHLVIAAQGPPPAAG